MASIVDDNIEAAPIGPQLAERTGHAATQGDAISGVSHSVFTQPESIAVLRLADSLPQADQVPLACIPTKNGYMPGNGIRNTLRLHNAPPGCARGHRRLRCSSSSVGAAHHPVLHPAQARSPWPSARHAPSGRGRADRSTMGRNLNPLERRGLVRIEVGDADQRERIVYLTAAGEAAMKAALPRWRKAQQRIATLVEPSAIAELADQLDAGGRVTRFFA